MNKTIKFIAVYDEAQNNKQNRTVSLAAYTKMQCILQALRNNGFEVEIVSMSPTLGRQSAPATRFYRDDGICIKHFYSIGRRSFVHRALNRIMMWIQLVMYVLTTVKKSDIIFVYHHFVYMFPVTLIKKLTGCRIVLELEELYSDVLPERVSKKQELRYARMADGYIFPTQLLDDAVNRQGKPAVIAHGTYRTERDLKCRLFEDNLQPHHPQIIHCVYAGTLDPRKGGAVAAAAAAEFLPENYHVHILGFGNEKEKKNMQELVEELSKKCRCGITYDGLLSGEEYIRFIQSCDIGLSTQSPDAAFNLTSFPSKVLSYMANGLRVVSVRIEAVERSAVSDLITFYNEPTPEQIAQAIMRVDMTADYDSRARLSELNSAFTQDLRKMLEAL